MKLPKSFQKNIIGAFGQQGEKWLETLEQKVDQYLLKWDLINIGPVENLSYNYVLSVKDKDNRPFILKLGVPNFDFRNEIQTVKAYNGDGCARLIKADPIEGVMLLEHLIPGKMLSDLKDEDKVIEEYIKVWKAIRRPLSLNPNIPMISSWATALKGYLDKYPNDNGPISNELVQYAEKCFEDVWNSSKEAEILHGDLHHENILFSVTRGWLAIDPKGVGGDPYFDFAAYLYNHLFSKPNPKSLLEYRVRTICERLRLDHLRFLKAAVAMSTLSACWATEDMSGWENTYQCARWLVEMIESNDE